MELTAAGMGSLLDPCTSTWDLQRSPSGCPEDSGCCPGTKAASCGAQCTPAGQEELTRSFTFATCEVSRLGLSRSLAHKLGSGWIQFKGSTGRSCGGQQGAAPPLQAPLGKLEGSTNIPRAPIPTPGLSPAPGTANPTLSPCWDPAAPRYREQPPWWQHPRGSPQASPGGSAGPPPSPSGLRGGHQRPAPTVGRLRAPRAAGRGGPRGPRAPPRARGPPQEPPTERRGLEPAPGPGHPRC